VRESSLGGPLLWPAEEAWPVCESEEDHNEPITMVAVLQIFARDVPELAFPADTVGFQLLWCPALRVPSGDLRRLPYLSVATRSLIRNHEAWTPPGG
jgi:hypothetical protein